MVKDIRPLQQGCQTQHSGSKFKTLPYPTLPYLNSSGPALIVNCYSFMAKHYSTTPNLAHRPQFETYGRPGQTHLRPILLFTSCPYRLLPVAGGSGRAVKLEPVIEPPRRDYVCKKKSTSGLILNESDGGDKRRMRGVRRGEEGKRGTHTHRERKKLLREISVLK